MNQPPFRCAYPDDRHRNAPGRPTDLEADEIDAAEEIDAGPFRLPKPAHEGAADAAGGSRANDRQ